LPAHITKEDVHRPQESLEGTYLQDLHVLGILELEFVFEVPVHKMVRGGCRVVQRLILEVPAYTTIGKGSHWHEKGHGHNKPIATMRTHLSFLSGRRLVTKRSLIVSQAMLFSLLPFFFARASRVSKFCVFMFSVCNG
jgi:hypothetical protein